MTDAVKKAPAKPVPAKRAVAKKAPAKKAAAKKAEPQRRLRVLHVQVRPVLVWDDGETMTPGPPTEPSIHSMAALADLADKINSEVAALSEA